MSCLAAGATQATPYIPIRYLHQKSYMFPFSMMCFIASSEKPCFLSSLFSIRFIFAFSTAKCHFVYKDTAGMRTNDRSELMKRQAYLNLDFVISHKTYSSPIRYPTNFGILIVPKKMMNNPNKNMSVAVIVFLSKL